MKLSEIETALDKLEHGWIRVKVPVPFPLRYVNAYLIPDADGWTLIDPGLRTPETEQVWEAVLKREGIAADRIKAVVLTHQHPDHIGLAGWFQERTGAPVYMSEAAWAYALRLWGPDRTFTAELQRLFLENGLPQSAAAGLEEHLESFVGRVSPLPDVAFIREGGTLDIGGMRWEIIDTPGHADGHLCFYQRESRLMFCGDHVLPGITPNVSLVPGCEPGVLARYLAALKKLSPYEVELALPGHRDPFRGLRSRIAEIQDHHARRLAEMTDMLKEPLTGYALCMRMFGSRVQDSLHNLRFAMSETLAHLEYLQKEGRIAAEMDAEGIMHFRRN